jgi:drug/metabolite transporter (DMT)-like permease
MVDSIDVMHPRPDAGRDQTMGILLVLAAAALFGSGPFFARIAYDAGMSPLPLLTWRFLCAAAVAWAILLVSSRGRRTLRVLTPGRVAVLIGLGALYVGNSGAYTAALKVAPVALVAIITYLYPAVVAVLSLRFVRRLEGRRPWASLALSTVGVALAVGGVPAGTEMPILGISLAFAGAVCYALWIVLAARLAGERPRRRGRGRSSAMTAPPADAEVPPVVSQPERAPDPLPSTAIMTLTTGLVAGILAVLVGQDAAPSAVPSAAWPAVIAFGSCSAIAVLTFVAGSRRTGAARAAIISTVEPVYTIALATLLLDEHLTPIQLAGGALVICGVLLAGSSGGDTTTEPQADPSAEGGPTPVAGRATV